jgi:Tat protein secretion system quality control protein TatD with DNase activity
MIRALPIDRLLVETDSPHQLDLKNILLHSKYFAEDLSIDNQSLKIQQFEESHFLKNSSHDDGNCCIKGSYLNQPSTLPITVARIAKIRDVSPKILAKQIYQNSIRIMERHISKMI